MDELFDISIKDHTARCIRIIKFRKEKMQNAERVIELLDFVCGKLKDRYNNVMVSIPVVTFYNEYANDLTVARINFKCSFTSTLI